MVGDWIYAIDENGDRHICRANILKYDYVNKLEDFCVDFFGTDYEAKWPDVMFDTEPIPLTSEILEKNGFEKWEQPELITLWTGYGEDNGEDIEVDFKKDEIVVKIDIKGSYLVTQEVRSVHELQHIFKMCKINKDIVL